MRNLGECSVVVSTDIVKNILENVRRTFQGFQNVFRKKYLVIKNILSMFVGHYHPNVSSKPNYNLMGMLADVVRRFPVCWAAGCYQYT
jgi:hypothetical protein